MEVIGEATELAAAQKSLLIYGIAVALVILFLLQASFGSLRLALLLFLTLPMALAGGVLAVWLGGGILTMGSLMGVLTVFGIAARNGILMISHFQHPMAIVILGGLVTSTLLNLFVLPSLYLRFGKSKRVRAVHTKEV